MSIANIVNGNDATLTLEGVVRQPQNGRIINLHDYHSNSIFKANGKDYFYVGKDPIKVTGKVIGQGNQEGVKYVELEQVVCESENRGDIEFLEVSGNPSPVDDYRAGEVSTTEFREAVASHLPSTQDPEIAGRLLTFADKRRVVFISPKIFSYAKIYIVDGK